MNNIPSNLLEISHLEICYNHKIVVSDINLAVKSGEILCIVGESGSGKTTLLKACMGILNKDGAISRGDIFFNGVNLIDNPKNILHKIYGKDINMIWQNASTSFCPIRTIGSQLVEYVQQHEKYSKNEVFDIALNLFDKLGLQNGKNLLSRYPFELSGGMNQRLGIIFAMILKPQLLFADEPTSALDVTTQMQVLKELLKLKKTFNTSIVMVTHNIAIAKYLADKIAVMHKGKIIEYNTAKEIISNPQEDYTKNLLNAVIYLDI